MAEHSGKAQNGMDIAPKGIVPNILRFRCYLQKEKEPMLWTIVVILLILWLLGFTMFHVGSLIHLLLVIALIVIVINLVSGRRAV